MMNPRCWTPGRTARAHKPTMKPIMIDQMMCNMRLMLNRLPGPRRFFFQEGSRPAFAEVYGVAGLLALPIGFVDREIFVPRRTESIDHPRFFAGLNAMRHITRQVEGIACLHVMGRSVDDQLHSPGQYVDDLLLRMLVRGHFAAGLKRSQHLIHRLSAGEGLAFDSGADLDPRIFVFHKSGLGFDLNPKMVG